MTPVSHSAKDFTRDVLTPSCTLSRDEGAVARYFGSLKKANVPENFRNACNCLKTFIIQTAVDATKRRGVSVLDIGAGRGGDLLKWARHRPQRYIGFDASPNSILEAIERHKNLVSAGKAFVPSEFKCVDLIKEAIPLETGSVDIVSMQFSLQYFFKSESVLDRMLREIKRVVRPGGAICCVFPDGDCVRDTLLNRRQPEVFGVRSFPHTPYLLLAPPSPPFGIPYTFAIAGEADVGCPEYVVSLNLLRQRLKEHGFEVLYDKRADEVLAHEKVDTLKMSPSEWKSLSLFRALCASSLPPGDLQ